MNLKESFRYQNYLDELFSRIHGYLCSRGNVTKVTEYHMRSKANPEAEDETVDASEVRLFDFPVGHLIDFMLAVSDEKRRLSVAIAKAKSACPVLIDAEIAGNRMVREIAACLGRMGSIKASENKLTRTGYKFNAEGNQTPYAYEVKSVVSIDFDRNAVKKIAREQFVRADETSAEIDRALIETMVDIEPVFSVSDSFEDAVEAFVERQSYESHAV